MTVDQEAFAVSETEKQLFIDFCNTYEIDIKDKEPEWYLSCYGKAD
jgi:hypothetical protein